MVQAQALIGSKKKNKKKKKTWWSKLCVKRLSHRSSTHKCVKLKIKVKTKTVATDLTTWFVW